MTSNDITPGDFRVTLCGAYVDSWRGYGPQDGPGWTMVEFVDSHEAAFEARTRMEQEARDYYGDEFLRWTEIEEIDSEGEAHRWNYTDHAKQRARRQALRDRIRRHQDGDL